MSASPSNGYTNYSRGAYAALLTNDNDLETIYTEQEVEAVDTNNGTSVEQTGSNGYILHQFKNFVGANTSCQLHWEGQTTLAAHESTVYLQIYNQTLDRWDTVTYNARVNQDRDFEIIGEVRDLSDYKTSENTISCRVYQLSPA